MERASKRVIGFSVGVGSWPCLCEKHRAKGLGFRVEGFELRIRYKLE